MQLGAVLFDKLKLGGEDAERSEKTGEYVVNQAVLEKLSQHHSLPKHILEYRALTKLHSTYIQGLQKRINPYTGRIHTTFQNALTVTGTFYMCTNR